MLAPTPPDPRDAPLALRLALRLVWLCSLVLPTADRRAWRAEWNAELVTREQARARRSGLAVLWHAAGAARDALYLTTHGFRLSNLMQDTGLAFRALRKRPGFTVTAIVTLTLAIGANTALFSVVNGVLLRPFPYHEPDRLVQLLGHRAGEEAGSGNVSYPNLHDLEQDVAGFSGVAGLSSWRPALTGDEPEVLAGATVSWDYFDVLGLTPAAGRFFAAENEGEGREPVVVISHGLWTRRYGADPDVVGSSISVNNTSHLVLGVTPASFEGPGLISFSGEQPEIWRTPWFDAPETYRSGRSWRGVARLAPGVGPDAAQTELSVRMARLAEQYPQENADRLITIRPLRDSVVGETRSALYVLLGAVGLVLLIACVNVANLFTGRMLERVDELLVRNALGASHGRLAAHLFAESLAISIAGGVLGTLLAFGGVRAMVAMAGYWLPRPDAIAVDGPVLVFSAGLAVGTAFLFGLVPALRLLRGARVSGVSGPRGGGAFGRRAGVVRRWLVLAQIATTVVLVVGAGLLVQTFRNLHDVELGVVRDGVITADLHGAALWDLEADAASNRYRDIIERVTALPGVTASGAIDVLPLADNYSCDGITPLDRPAPAPGEGRCAEVRSATPGALEALGVRRLAGRMLEWGDGPDSRNVMVVSERTAEMFWPGDDVIGKQALVHGDTFAVVGMVADIRHFGPLGDVGPMVILPSRQEPWNGMSRGLSLIASGDEAVESIGPSLIDAVHAVDPLIAVERVGPLTSLLAATVGGPRLRATLLAVFAALALALALVGVAGVMAQAVAKRRREIGVRIALGASPRMAAGIVLREGARITLLGLTFGLIAATAFTRLLEAFVYGVNPLDPWIMALGGASVCVLSLLASWLPARRASRIDPVEALRAE